MDYHGNDLSLFDYNNNRIQNFGIIKLKLSEVNTGTARFADFVVVEDKCEPILGLKTCTRFGLVKRIDMGSVSCTSSKELFMEQHKEMFHGLGKFPGTFRSL